VIRKKIFFQNAVESHVSYTPKVRSTPLPAPKSPVAVAIIKGFLSSLVKCFHDWHL